MSDITTEVTETPEVETETAPEEATEETKEETKEKAAKNEPHACLCSTFLFGDPSDLESLFTTECEATTLRTFAQGHDARLVSTLVNAQFDGYSIFQRNTDGNLVGFENAAHACSSASDALGAKADSATKNMQAKIDAKNERLAVLEQKKAERKAEKDKKDAEKAAAKAAREAEKAEKATPASGPRAVGATVVPGSQEGDLPSGFVVIKIGRHEYEGTLSEDGTEVTYRNNIGEEQTRKVDEVRVLKRG